LKAEDGSLYITSKHNILKVAYRAVVRRWWKIIFYKDAFAIEVGIFRPFFSDEIHFAGYKVLGVNKTKWTHWTDWTQGFFWGDVIGLIGLIGLIGGINFINSILWSG